MDQCRTILIRNADEGTVQDYSRQEIACRMTLELAAAVRPLHSSGRQHLRGSGASDTSKVNLILEPFVKSPWGDGVTASAA
jgi:hypothetical protein